MDVITANKIAAVIIANFGKRNDRPFLLSVAVFIAEQENGAKTSDIVKEFYDVEGCDSVAYGDRMSTMNKQLVRMEKAGILSKKFEEGFVPKFSSRYRGSGLGKFVKNNAARWRIKLDLAT